MSRNGHPAELTRYCRMMEQKSLHSSAISTAVEDAGSASFSCPSTWSDQPRHISPARKSRDGMRASANPGGAWHDVELP